MRLLVDLQACQFPARSREDADRVRGFVKALARRARREEVWLLLNEALPGAAGEIRAGLEGLVPPDRIRTFEPPGPVAERDPANAWRARAAERVREHVIADLRPDVVLLPDLFAGFAEDAVVSIGCLGPSTATAVLLDDPEPLHEADGLAADVGRRAFTCRRLQSLKRAALVLTGREEVRRTAIDRLGLRAEGVRRVPGEPFEAARAEAVWVELRRLHATRRRRERSGTGLPRLRPRLAYVSPLPPTPSGIADYSAELVPELARFYRVELVTDRAEVADPWLAANFAVRSAEWFDANADRFDRILYHVGNSPFHAFMLDLLERHPGVVVLHDFFLGHLMGRRRDLLAAALYESHGYPALRRLREAGYDAGLWEFPCNDRVLRHAAGLIVHARHSTELAERWYGPERARRWVKVPHLHAPPPPLEKGEARRRLGIEEGAFVVCAFGQLGPTKLNHRLVEAWLASKLARDERCRLVFVGAKYGDGYTTRVMDRIRISGAATGISITGFVAPDVYRAWLAAADVAVQLRTRSRGESSAAVLDCLVRGLPLVVNAHGSAAELPEGIALELPDAFADRDLIHALERLRDDAGLRAGLGRAAADHVRRWHAAERVGRLYRRAIETLSVDARQAREAELIDAISRIGGEVPPEPRDLLAVSEAIARVRPARGRQLLIDVSAVARHDLGTGVQRVVRAQVQQLLADPPEGIRVEPVMLCEDEGPLHYRYARRYTSALLGLAGGERTEELADEPVDVRQGDVFLGADLHPVGVAQASEAGLYGRWRARGVRVHFMVYDLLPVLHPEWFPEGAAELHARWLRSIAREADGLVCISASVADDLARWLAGNGEQADGLAIRPVHLGADIPASAPTEGLPEEARQVLDRLRERPAFLMVGTVEPRKGHLQVLAAFERLWEEGVDLQLVVVGREGWKRVPEERRRTLPAIVRTLREHPERGRRLLWLEDASDEYLEEIYEACVCLLAASEGEGFGLPLIEAAQHGLPILARDIPVFREVAGDHAAYFDGSDPGKLAETIRDWLRLHREGRHPRSSAMPWRTWQGSVAELREILLGAAPPTPDSGLGLVCEDTSAAAPGLDDLRYLEKVRDREQGEDRGPLAGKEILVYAPAKTGTITLYHALADYLAPRRGWSAPETKLLHNHYNELLIDNLELPEGITAHDLRERRVARDLVRYKELTGGQVEVVTSFRDPLSRAISDSFQAIDGSFRRSEGARIADLDFDTCHERFLTLLERSLDRPHPLEEIEPDFLEREAFDHGTKSCFVDRGHCRILALCLEHSSRWREALETHLGLRGIELPRRNVTEEKPVAALYRDFRERLELSPALLRRVYFGDNRVARQLRWFYTRDEIDAFYERGRAAWGRRRERAAQAPVSEDGRRTPSRSVL